MRSIHTSTRLAGIMDIHPINMTRAGESYAYSYRRFMSDLYIVEGLV